MTSNSGDLVKAENRLTTEQLRHVTSFEDALALLDDQNYVAEDFAKNYGTGFTILEDKSRLVGVDMVLLEWQFNTGENGRFVSAALVTVTGEKLIVNDGSTGIMQQLDDVVNNRHDLGMTLDEQTHGLGVRGGLRMSEYPCREDGTPLTRDEQRDHPELGVKRGRTFYLNT